MQVDPRVPVVVLPVESRGDTATRFVDMVLDTGAPETRLTTSYFRPFFRVAFPSECAAAPLLFGLWTRQA